MTVHETLRHYAQYNQLVNFEILSLLDRLPEDSWEKDTGSYFKTVPGLLNHILSGDLVWMQRFLENGIAATRVGELFAEIPFRGFDVPHFHGLTEFKPIRKTVDEAWLRIVGAFRSEDLEQSLTYVNFRGVRTTLEVSQALFHLFNHQTHHRGALAQILDAWGVPNDYSSILRVFV